MNSWHIVLARHEVLQPIAVTFSKIEANHLSCRRVAKMIFFLLLRTLIFIIAKGRLGGVLLQEIPVLLSPFRHFDAT